MQRVRDWCIAAGKRKRKKKETPACNGRLWFSPKSLIQTPDIQTQAQAQTQTQTQTQAQTQAQVGITFLFYVIFFFFFWHRRRHGCTGNSGRYLFFISFILSYLLLLFLGHFNK
jgi:hypothetical protein